MPTPRSLTAAALALLALALGACSGGAPAPTPSATAPPEAPARAGSVRPPTPDAAGEAFLRALGNSDPVSACRVMAAGGQVIETQPAAMEMCVSAMSHAGSQANAAAGEALKEASVRGAAISGDSADFSSAAVTPPAAAQILGTMRAIRVEGAWYVSD